MEHTKKKTKKKIKDKVGDLLSDPAHVNQQKENSDELPTIGF